MAWRSDVQIHFSLYAVIATLLTVALAKQQCSTHPNYESNEYTYMVCTGTYVKDLPTSRKFCQENLESGDVITFPNKSEFDFITKVMNKTIKDVESFKYVPGFYQKSKKDNKYNPETGKYYWITDPDTQITNESTTYWKPFEEFIHITPTDSLTKKQLATVVLDAQGRWYMGVSLGGGDSRVDVHGGVICMKRGVPEVTESPVSDAEKIGGKEEPIEYWIIIAAAGGVVVIGVLLALTAFCIFKKKQKDSQHFEKVPQSENNHNNNSSPKRYSDV